MLEVFEQVIYLLPEFFQGTSQISAARMLTGFIVVSHRQFFHGIAHFYIPFG